MDAEDRVSRETETFIFFQQVPNDPLPPIWDWPIADSRWLDSIGIDPTTLFLAARDGR